MNILFFFVVVGLIINQILLRRRIDNIIPTLRSVRRGLISERGRLKARPTLRNRELMQLGRDIENEKVLSD